MPPTRVVCFRDSRGRLPVREWLRDLLRRDRRAHAKLVVRIERLAERGHELRRPEVDYLRDDIFELRARIGRVNYRILYFFHGQDVAVLARALTKEDGVPDADIDRAREARVLVTRNPEKFMHEE
jgi:hypothetical protein